MPGSSLGGFNQFLFGVQNVIFSLSQAVQILGMNTQALKQLLETVMTTFDHAVRTYREVRRIELAAAADESESKESKQKRRRLKALRWAAVSVLTYAGYRLVRYAFRSVSRSQRSLTDHRPQSLLQYQH